MNEKGQRLANADNYQEETNLLGCGAGRCSDKSGYGEIENEGKKRRPDDLRT